MGNLKFILFAVSLFLLIQCKPSDSNLHVSKTNEESAPSVNYSNLIIGTWEGESPYSNTPNVPTKMYVTFKDGNMTVESSLSDGRKHTVPYKFKDERTIQASGYEDNLIIEKISDNQISFKPEGDRMRVDFLIIYTCLFSRVREQKNFDYAPPNKSLERRRK